MKQTEDGLIITLSLAILPLCKEHRISFLRSLLDSDPDGEDLKDLADMELTVAEIRAVAQKLLDAINGEDPSGLLH